MPLDALGDFRKLFEHGEYALHETPYNKRPVRAVPHTGDKPHDEIVEYEAAFCFHARAAEREKEIIPEPRGQRYMPSRPKLGQCARHVRIVEVFEEVEAEHAPHADCHVGVAAEVKIKLQGIGHRTCPREAHAHACRGEGDLHKLGQDVCKQHFLGKTREEAQPALHKVLARGAARHDLVHHRGVAHYGACYELREEGYVQPEIGDVVLRGDAAVNVDDIAHRLEGEKRNAYRQGDVGLVDERAR